jgi:hypothetical protein
MKLKWLIPGRGDYKTLSRLRDLEQKAGTLPVMFALFFTKAIEITVLAIPAVFIDLPSFVEPIFDAIKMFIAAMIVGAMHIYEIQLRNVFDRDDDGEVSDEIGIE